MSKPVFKIECFVSEEDLRNIALVRGLSLDDDEMQEQCDDTESYEDDITIASIETENRYIELCTTNSKHNLCVFEHEIDNDNNNDDRLLLDLIDVRNVSGDFEEIVESYQALCGYLTHLVW